MIINISDIISKNFFGLHKDIKEQKHTHYWLKGGRGSLKSSFISIEIVFGIMKDPLANAVVLRKTGETLKDSVYNQILWAIDMLKVDKYWTSKISPLELTYNPTGQKIVFRSSHLEEDARKIKSTKFIKGYCKFIWFEEVDEFFGMEEIRQINQSLMRGGNNFICLYSYNPPKSINNWTNAEILSERADKIVHSSTYKEAPREWLGEQFIIEAEHLEKTNELAYKHEYLGVPTGTGGAVFDNLTIRHITDEEIKGFDNISDGIDFGYAVDPVCYGQDHYDSTRNKLYIFNEIYKVGMSNKKLHDEIVKIKVGKNDIIADSAEPKSIAELNSYGDIKVFGAKKGPDSVEYGIRWLQSLEEIIIDNVRCPNTAREFSTYEYEKDKYGNFKSKYPDINNHSIDKTRYSREKDMKFVKAQIFDKNIFR